MSIRSRLYMMALMSMALTSDTGFSHNKYSELLSDDEKTDLKAEFEAKQEALKIKQGVCKFWYGSHYIWARNKKNADRKAKNAGYL